MNAQYKKKLNSLLLFCCVALSYMSAFFKDANKKK